MKTFNRSVALLVALALLLESGCGSPKKTAYQTLDVIGASVFTAMQIAAKAKVAGKLNDAQWAQVSAAYTKYVAAYNAACDAAAFDTSKFAPTDVLQLKTDLFNLITALGVQTQ